MVVDMVAVVVVVAAAAAVVVVVVVVDVDVDDDMVVVPLVDFVVVCVAHSRRGSRYLEWAALVLVKERGIRTPSAEEMSWQEPS